MADVLDDLITRYPGLREHLLEQSGTIRNYVNVFVGDENIRDREHEQTTVTASDEVLIVPALGRRLIHARFIAG